MEIAQSLARHGTGVVFADVLAQQLGVVVAATVAATALADAVRFLLGRRYHRKVTRVLSSPGSNQPRRESRFERWGIRSLLRARFLPGAVQLIILLAPLAPLAGARHVKLAGFLFYDLTGIVLSASLPVTGGMLFHHQAETLLSELTSGAPWLAVAALVVASGVLVWRRRFGRGRSQWAPRS